MSASNVVTDDGRRTTEVSRRSPVIRLPSARTVGWVMIIAGAVADLSYHIPILLFGTQWPTAVDTIGEFGHTVIFVGIVTVIFAVLRRHSPKS